MTSNDRIGERRVALGKVTRTTEGGVRGTIEAFGLYTPAIRIS
jgi:hypothetical protein